MHGQQAGTRFQHLSEADTDLRLADPGADHHDPGPVPDRAETQLPPAEPVSVPPAPARSVWRAKIGLALADALAVVTAGAVAAALLHRWDPQADRAPWQLLWTTAATVPLWIWLFSSQRLYNTRFIARRIDELHRVVNATILATLGVAAAAGMANVLLRRSGLVLLALCALVTVGIEREGARRLFASLRSHGLMQRQVIVAGANPEGRDIAAMLRTEPWLGYQVVGFVDDGSTLAEPVPGVPLLGHVHELPAIVGRYPGASVIVASSGVESAVTNRMARDLLDRGIHVELSSTLRDIASERLTVRPLGRFPVVYVEPVAREGWRAVAKRTFDVVAGGIALLVASPVLLVAAVAIKLDSRGPVLFRQVRVGRNSEPFHVLKLRSMVPDAEDHLHELQSLNEADGPLFKIAHDPRVTRVGRILRMSSIDELPQLWNVLRGQMSLVGPRPALPHETEEWDALLAQRLRVKPGMTGMWQVSGRSDTSFEDYTRLDLYYVDNWTLTTDLAILAKTLPAVLMRQGAR